MKNYINIALPYEFIKENCLILNTRYCEEDAEYYFNEDKNILNENYIFNDMDDVKKASENIKKETNRMLKKLESKLSDNPKKYAKKLYNLQAKLGRRYKLMKDSYDSNYIESCLHFLIYTGDIYLLASWLEIPNVDGLIKGLLRNILNTTTLGASSIANLVVTKKLATTKAARDEVKSYIDWLKNTMAEIEKLQDKLS